ncbi:hypothetical protein Barb7_02900 [Bacteroidales bacterium Barb7]|nr:hypothetical protein Barb7_02900 [Bacteroidales bacterium Barb7]
MQFLNIILGLCYYLFMAVAWKLINLLFCCLYSFIQFLNIIFGLCHYILMTVAREPFQRLVGSRYSFTQIP